MPKGSFIWGNAMYSFYALAVGYEPVKSSTQTSRCGFFFTPDPQSYFFKVNISWERNSFLLKLSMNWKGAGRLNNCLKRQHLKRAWLCSSHYICSSQTPLPSDTTTTTPKNIKHKIRDKLKTSRRVEWRKVWKIKVTNGVVDVMQENAWQDRELREQIFNSQCGLGWTWKPDNADF